MSEISLSKLISDRKEELARLMEYRGTDFPVVERQNDLRISFIEFEIEDLEKLNYQPQLNEKQQELLDDLKYVYTWQHSHVWDLFYYLVENDHDIFEEETLQNFQDMSDKDSLEVQIIFSKWVLEQEEE